MVDGKTDLEMLIAARICSGLGSVLNWSGKKYSVRDFLPAKESRPMIATAAAIDLLLKRIPTNE
jgi:hypothetical protein